MTRKSVFATCALVLGTFASDARAEEASLTFLQGLHGAEYRPPADRVVAIRGFVTAGKDLLKKHVVQGQAYPHITDQAAYMNAILALNWALFDEAVRKSQGFTSGTIVIEDPGFRTYQFLLDYVALKGGSTGLSTTHHVSTNCYAYRRASTHFPELQARPDFRGHFGIDIRFGTRGPEQLLPANKKHFAFGVVNGASKPLVFLKWEDYGLCATDGSVVKHAENLLNKGKDPNQIGHREDVPHEVSERFTALAARTPASTHRERDEASAAGIHAMIPFAQKHLGAEGQAFARDVGAKYDHAPLRRGDEVILTVDEVRGLDGGGAAGR